ncbi:MAG: VacJ family lipoprotein [Thermodesulfobacteriota bacterium]
MSLRCIYGRFLIALVFVLTLFFNAGAMASVGESGEGNTLNASTIIYSTNGGLGQGYVGRPQRERVPLHAGDFDDSFLNEGYTETEQEPLTSTVIYSMDGGLGQGYVGRPQRQRVPLHAGDFDESFLNEGYTRSEQEPIVSTVIYTNDAGQVVAALDDDEDFLEDDDEFEGLEETEGQAVSDPLEGFNRAMFVVNDKLYFWVLRPVALGYSKVVPEPGRVAMRRFFENAFMPVRFANNVLQFKLKSAGIELARFVINSTIGVAGFMDPAKTHWNLAMQEEDFGQTLGYYGFGPGAYLNLPFFGPSNIRDALGMVADIFVSPTTYVLPNDREIVIGIDLYRRINEASLEIGLYEDIKRDALDPYIFIRNAYQQHRESLIKK